ncbi:MAG: hypothetical protein AAGD25_14175 [Cyanobacteria bacterium P01_F01_bin.150]
MESNLEQLIAEAQAYGIDSTAIIASSSSVSPLSASPSSASPVLELVERLLRSRRIGRAHRGEPLTGIYKVMCDRLRQELLTQLPHALEQYQVQGISARDWGQDLVSRASQVILDDAQLKQLALEAQDHSAQTPLRQHALMQLVEGIRLSGRLARPHRSKYSPQFYDLLYEEAVNRTLTYVCRRIETYDPNRGEKQKFMNWVNFRLDRMIIECRREFGEAMVDDIPALDDLDKVAQPEESDSLADEVRECIEQDAEQVFASAHIRNRPDASFRMIALARFDGKSWDDISQELAIKIPTLSSFFQRCCQKFAPIFQS